MKLLHRLYIIRDFFVAFPTVVIGLSGILSLVNLIDKLDDFMKSNAPVQDLILYAVLNLPKNLFYLFPMAILICSLFVLTKASKNNEIVIIKASGGRLRSLLIPFIIVGCILSAFGFILGEYIMPVSNKMAEELKTALTSPKPKGAITSAKTFSYQKNSPAEGTLWLKDKRGSIIRIGLYSYENRAANDIKIFVFEDGVPSETLEAEKALWDGHTWTLVNVRRFILKSGQIQIIEQMTYHNLESPEFFAKWIKKPEEMSVGELARYIKRLKESGYRNPKLVVDLNSRLSYPFVNLFMLMIGISLPLRSRMLKGLIASSIGLVISLLYWGGYILSLSLGNAGILPPFLAPWIIPAVFAVISISLFRAIPE